MNTLQKTKLRGTGINCGLIVLLFAVVLLLGQVLPDNTYRRVLVPIIWQMCIFILLGTSLNLTLGYLGQLHARAHGLCRHRRVYCCATSLALARAGLFEVRKQRPVSSFWSFRLLPARRCLRRAAGPASWASRRCGCTSLAIVTLGFGLIVENVIVNLPSPAARAFATARRVRAQRARPVDLTAGKVRRLVRHHHLCIALGVYVHPPNICRA